MEYVNIIVKDQTPAIKVIVKTLGVKGEKGDAPTDAELNALIDVAIVPYVTSMDTAIDIINGQII